MPKLPNPNWSQVNFSDKFGNVWMSRNLNFDEQGYVKLSPRMINLFDDSADTANLADTDMGRPVAFGRYDIGKFRVTSTDAPVNLTISDSEKTIAEDTSSNNPSCSTLSHSVWWQNKWHTSTATAINSNSGGTWTANVVTGLTSGKRHYMEVFKNRNTLCITDGNTVLQKDTGYSASITLTLPSDFEAIGLAYNNNRMGVITRLGSDSAAQNANAFFFIWNGSATSAQAGYDIGASQCIAIVPYKSSFVILDSEGRLLYFNGGGFDVLAEFPFYNEEGRISDFLNFIAYGDNMVADGDLVYINIHYEIDPRGPKGNRIYRNNPSGIWCYDPKVGLYHRWSPSISQVYFHTITQANVNTSTNVFTTSSTIPATGNPVLLTSGTVGGLSTGVVYFVIKLSSTTFSLATTKANALAGTAIDITSADTNQYFWMYNLVDYGQARYNQAAGLAVFGNEKYSYRDIICGANLDNTSVSSLFTISCAVPNLENRGELVSPKLFSSSTKDKSASLLIRYRPLDTNDKIIVKTKTKDILNLYVTFDDTNSQLTWTSPNECYTSAVLTEAQAYFDAGHPLELTLVGGVGAGQQVQVTDMTYDSNNGVTSFVLEEDVIGATGGLISYGYIDNWEKVTTIDQNSSVDNLVEVTTPIPASKFVQYKLEFRGYVTTIEDIEPNIKTYQNNK